MYVDITYTCEPMSCHNGTAPSGTKGMHPTRLGRRGGVAQEKSNFEEWRQSGHLGVRQNSGSQVNIAHLPVP